MPIKATRLPLIAGPCSAESEEQVLDTARRLSAVGVSIFRAGLWKPRTHPGSFEGVGARGLPWLLHARAETGMRIATEAACAQHVEQCLKAGIDIIWLGARTTANPFMVQEIADALRGARISVLVKNPVSEDLGLWAGALERLGAAGISDLGLIHRGVASLECTPYRNAPAWRFAAQMRSRFPQMPFYCDPSHIAGNTLYIKEISQKALDLGFDSLMIEAHCKPQQALSDGSQQLTPEQLGVLLDSLTQKSECPAAGLEALRADLDELDRTLVGILGKRMALSRRIGEFKKKHDIAIMQGSRWEAVLHRAIEGGVAEGLDENFVRNLFSTIHAESVRIQDETPQDGRKGR